MRWFSQTVLALLLLALNATAATVQISSAALISATTDQEYFSSMNRMPASNSVQRLNPPVFQWRYYQDVSQLNNTATFEYTNPRAFNLQLVTNGNFAGAKYYDITTSNIFYNFLWPITNADGSTWTGTCSWRVRELDTNGTEISISPVHTFSMPANAEQWDRSMFASRAFAMGFSNAHPHIFTKATNIAAFRSFVNGSTLSDVIPGVTFNSFTSTLSVISSADWKSDNTLTNNYPSWVFLSGYIADMGVAYHGITNAWWTNAVDTASPSVASVLTNFAAQCESAVYNYDRTEGYAGNFYAFYGLAVSYDSFYHLLNASQRVFLRRVMRNWAAFYVFENTFFTGSSTNLDRVYGSRPLIVRYPSLFKQGESHMRHDRGALWFALAIYGEEDPGEEDSMMLMDYFLNYYIARFDPYGYSGEDPRIYGGISTILDYARSFQPWVAANMMFYDKKLTNAPVYNELADVVQFHTPTGHRAHLNPWGQVSCYCENYFIWDQNPWQYTAFAVHAAMQGRGDYYRQHLRAGDSTLGGTRIGESTMLQSIATPFYWPAPTQTDRNTNSFIDPVRGWAVGLSGKPTDWDAFSNQVGFVFQARPTGTGRNSGGHFSDGQIEMWAYGVPVTAAGGGYFGQSALMHNGLFVDGVGVNNANPAIIYPIHARIDAYTNWGDGVFVRGDLTRVFNLSNYVGGGVGNLQSVSGSAAIHNYLQSSNARPYISSVKRSILAPHNRYLVIYDQMICTQAATLHFKWNAYPTNCTAVNPANMSFTYTATNNFTGRSNVTVLVQSIVNPASLSYTQLSQTINPAGSNNPCYALWNTFTGERYDYTNNWRVGAIEDFRYWASTVWIYRTTPATTQHLMTVVCPSRGDNNLFTVTRISDQTARIQGPDGIDDTISFDPAYAGTPNILVDLQSSSPGDPPPPGVPPNSRPRQLRRFALQQSEHLDGPWSEPAEFTALVDDFPTEFYRLYIRR